ncbi:chemotaxis protein CheD [Caldinitratiruptor microaerophilus]|uniref:Probable chemoreceptor glutamine deamidase CheD n=1 Tax=Caldinitratiruptor microaerophilus TaxID=671077 RepID=A0AA35CN38_9FIRM|nr:chemotaxis protein CheD [Caldinitratiruptor microaerophilus]BDG60340.1 chemotaxis protein CheD [Caldinitratiruptor microaerophilus]
MASGLRTVEVRMGQFRASRDAEVALETSSLGSCVAVALYDPEARVAGLCHILLDRESRFPGGVPERCADFAIPAALAEMVTLGASPERVVAHLAGGGNMFRGVTDPVYDVGSWNVAAAKEVLEALGIPVVTEDVGGSNPRRLRIEVATGHTSVHFPAGRGGA